MGWWIIDYIIGPIIDFIEIILDFFPNTFKKIRCKIYGHNYIQSWLNKSSFECDKCNKRRWETNHKTFIRKEKIRKILK